MGENKWFGGVRSQAAGTYWWLRNVANVMVIDEYRIQNH